MGGGRQTARAHGRRRIQTRRAWADLHIFDGFQELHDRLETDEYSAPEDRDEYVAENVFWVPKDVRWAKLQASAKQPTIGKLIDDAMAAIEKDTRADHSRQSNRGTV